jgi:hypothetical protein
LRGRARGRTCHQRRCAECAGPIHNGTGCQAEKKPASGGLAAARERQKKCGAEWKEAKKAGKVEKGMKWPQYWSACNKRMKAAG